MSKAVIVLHGGAGALSRQTMIAEKERDYRKALDFIICSGQTILANGGSVLDAVTEAVRSLEEWPLFNAGTGAVFTHHGAHELYASVMNGRIRAAGAVCGVRHIRNHILAARAVMEHSPQVMFTGEGAEQFAFRQGLARVENNFFSTPERYQQLQRALVVDGGALLDHDGEAADPINPDRKFSTVGDVACDSHGNLAAATSTGGMTNKQAVRVGDSPIIGACCYANNVTVAVSCSGSGEVFIHTAAAHELVVLLTYAGLSLEQVAARVIFDQILPMGGSGGLIAVDAAGHVALPFNSEGMYRALGYVGQAPDVGIYR